MAVDTIIVSDETKTEYLKRFPASFQKGYSQVLDWGKDKDLSQPHLFLAGDGLKRIRKTLRATFDSPESLAALIERQATVKIGDIPLELSPTQREALKGLARDMGTTPEIELEKILKQAVNDRLAW